MIGFAPFPGPPFFRRPYPHNSGYHQGKNNNSIDKNNLHNLNKSSLDFSKNPYFPNDLQDTEDNCFDFLGIKLHSDDLLIIFLLFILYNEDVKDTYLYIALILLLLS